MKKVIGTVTIGQSPRTDVIPDVASILGPDIEIREAGALDGLSPEIIASFAPQEGDYVLVTRLADGTSVQVAEQHITPRIHEKIAEHFTDGIPVVLLLCTGEFPDFETGGLLIRPQKVLFNAVAAVAKGMRIGILTPSPEQVDQSENRWGSLSPFVRAVPSSPYVNSMEAARTAAEELKEWKAEITVLDCIGYTLAIRSLVREITDRPALLARGVAASMVKELIG
ncbi:MAG TPA: AroM family protein [Aminivibrio sp.]|uniref:AroM family protein n=1 Tax=Aminivibrio sp. TaxID=1872489 RepID=UPI002C8DB4A2|nr:AroM family protein [Aminivibrio sp.]NCB16640.1 AroM family protein [Synergistales bacterium]HPF86127.1 AroM family protein [Aminivibrio sp.]